MGSAVGRVRSPDQNALAVPCRTGIEACNRITENVLQRRVTCSVTNRIRIDLGRTNVVEKTLRKFSCNDRARSGVMGLVNPIGAVQLINVSKPLGYLCESLVPRNALEFTASLIS